MPEPQTHAYPTSLSCKGPIRIVALPRSSLPLIICLSSPKSTVAFAPHCVLAVLILAVARKRNATFDIPCQVAFRETGSPFDRQRNKIYSKSFGSTQWLNDQPELFSKAHNFVGSIPPSPRHVHIPTQTRTKSKAALWPYLCGKILCTLTVQIASSWVLRLDIFQKGLVAHPRRM